jgi:hypothetical protein
MSTMLFLLCRANPGPGLAIAGLNLIAAFALVCVSFLLGIAVLLACLQSVGERVAHLAGAAARVPLASMGRKR